MTETHFVHTAYWESDQKILIQLCQDWTDRNQLPPLFLGPKPRPFASIERAPLSEYGRLAHYFIENGDCVFLLDPAHYPHLDLWNDAVYVVGSFNGWQEACGNPRWQLEAGDLDDHRFLLRRIPLAAVASEESPRFKFITESGNWIGVSTNAPNLVYDEQANANYALFPNRSGLHVFHATLPAEGKRVGNEVLLWADGEHREAVPIPSALDLLEIESSLPLGAIAGEEQTVFRVFAPRASRVEVRFAREPGGDPRTVRLRRETDGTWETTIKENLHGWCYHYHVYGRNQDASTHFDPGFPVLDPYARATLGARGPGIIIDPQQLDTTPQRPPFQPPDWHDLVILEGHLGDLVEKSPYRKNPEEPPRYRDLTEMLRDPDSYLRSLGINAIELQPLQQSDRQSPEDYHWGYMTTNFFAIESAYADEPRRASQIQEFRELVEAAHEAGIAVILDVVYNHVGDPAHLLFLDKYYYFEVDHLHELTNWSGCGNDLRCQAPMVRRLIIDSLRYLVRTFDIDGFRFDLAELLSKPVLEEIAAALKSEKPSLILIAEPWSFRGHIAEQLRDTPYASWNDGYRDFSRQYLSGHSNTAALRYFLAGSRDTVATWPAQTVNYTESHDDHCWLDAITENPDHNGLHPTVSDRRRTHLMAALLMMSFGMPMLAAGQDFLRSKQGVANTYLRGDLNALDYERLLYYANTHRYFRHWIRFRQGPWGDLLRMPEFPGEAYLQFHEAKDSSAVIVLYNADYSRGEKRMVFALNPHPYNVGIRCPDLTPDQFIQIADCERFNPQGLQGALLTLRKSLKRLPALSTFLWVSR